jgi:flagellar basal-body rod protein FlgB
MLATPMIQFIEHFLNVTSNRESLIANNMANIDTPGYKTEDLNFRSELTRVTGDSEEAAFTPVVQKVPGLLQRPDGNNVSLDRESMNLAESQLQFKMGIQFIRTEFHRLLNAINEGKSA